MIGGSSTHGFWSDRPIEDLSEMVRASQPCSRDHEYCNIHDLAEYHPQSRDGLGQYLVKLAGKPGNQEEQCGDEACLVRGFNA